MGGAIGMALNEICQWTEWFLSWAPLIDIDIPLLFDIGS